MARRAPSTSPKKSQNKTKAKEHWWKTPTVIAAIIAALAAISVAIINQHVTPKSKPSEPATINQQTHGSGSPTIAHVQGDVHVTNNYGIPKEEYDRLREELGVTDAALKSFFKILEQQQVPLEDLDSTLRGIAKHYKTLQEHLQTFTSDNSEAMALKQEARKALEAGYFAQAEKLLNEASQKSLEKVQRFDQQSQETDTKLRLDAAADKAALGAFKETQLRWAEAANDYRQAAALVESAPKRPEEILATYLNNWGFALFLAGDYHGVEPLYRRALAIRETVLGPEHPDVATSLHNLARLYNNQLRLPEAEPLYRRALAIRETVLGPEHPDVALTLVHLAALYSNQGRFPEAEPFYRRALAILEKRLGPEHPVTTSQKAYFKDYFGRKAETKDLMAGMRVIPSPKRGWLGIQLRHPEDAVGLSIEQVMIESPAAKAGLQQGDRIIRFNGHEVGDTEAFVRLVKAIAPGTPVNVEVLCSGQPQTIQVILGTTAEGPAYVRE